MVEKTIADPVSWQAGAGRTLRLSLELITPPSMPRLRLFGRAAARLPDRHVSLGLLCQGQDGVELNFERLDWRPNVPHNNPDQGPPALRFIRLTGSHHHAMSDNAGLPMGLDAAIGRALPVARPLAEELDWERFKRFAAGLWRIHGLADIPAPPWHIQPVAE